MPAKRKRAYPTINENNARLAALFNKVHEDIALLPIEEKEKEELAENAVYLQNKARKFYNETACKPPHAKTNRRLVEKDYDSFINILSDLQNNKISPEEAERCLKKSPLYSKEEIFFKNLIRFIAAVACAIAAIASLAAAVLIGLPVTHMFPILGVPVLIGTILLAGECTRMFQEVHSSYESFFPANEERKVKMENIRFFSSASPQPEVQLLEVDEESDEHSASCKEL